MADKYEFKQISLDSFELHYKKGEQEVILPFKRTVEIASKLQSIESEARFKMYEYLTKQGKTKKDLIIEKKDSQGRIVVDDSNYQEFEAGFVKSEAYRIMTEIYTETFNMPPVKLATELNLTAEEAYLFGTKFSLLLSKEVQDDKIPSETQTESVSSETFKLE